jgi:glycosyltransferase involved in cell wall biosynthesis
MVVAGSFSFSGVAAYMYAARHRIPFGLWNGDVAHQLHNRSYPALRTREREWLARKADFGIAYGWLAARYLSDLAPRLPSVIGRNTSVVHVTERRATDRRNGVALVAVADLSVPEKGFETVVDALRLLPDSSYRLQVIGNPPRDGALARAAGRDERITFLGPLPHDDVRRAYEQSDLFVFPSRMDIFGLALLEAMAAGLPAISSSVPGSVADLVVPQRNCLMADARDPRSWADAVVALAEAPALRASVGAAAQTTVRRRWTMAHAVEGTMAGFRLGALHAGSAA